VKVFRGNEVKVPALHIVLLWASKSASCLVLRGSYLDRWPDIRWFRIIIIIIIIIRRRRRRIRRRRRRRYPEIVYETVIFGRAGILSVIYDG